MARFSKQLDVNQRKHSYETFQQWITRLSSNQAMDAQARQIIQHYQKIVYLDQKDKSTVKTLDDLLKDYAIVLKVQKKTCQQIEK